VIVQLANGTKIAIPAAEKDRVMSRAAQEARTNPNGVVTGDCGSSYVYVQDKANDHPVRMTTGFSVVLPAIAYSWLAQVTGPNYNYTYESSGDLAFDSTWNGSHDSTLDYTEGIYSAAVSPDSFAELLTGDICFSLAPTDTEYLTSPDTPVSTSLSTNGPIEPATATKTAASGVPEPASATGGSSPGRAGHSGRVAPLSVFPPDTRTRVADTTAYPYSAIALLVITRTNGAVGRCTGFFYAPNIVATAGHCVYSQTSGWAAKIQVIPGNDVDSLGNTITPFGTCQGTTGYTTEGWVYNADRRYDYGAVKLNCSTGNQTGYFGLSWTAASLTGKPVTITGYPSDKPPSGSMWTAHGPINSSAERQVFYTISTAPRQSGSPVYQPGCGQYCALAVHASGGTTTNTGTRITQAGFDNYENWKS
jgi:glutamyl endopeptidase